MVSTPPEYRLTMTLAAGDEALQVGGPDAAGVAAGKEPFLAADGDRA
jgi:hypothetical protein